MSIFFSINGSLQLKSDQALSIENRSFRYGDGLFETIKVIDGIICHADLHFARLFSGMAILKFAIPEYFTPAYFQQQIMNVVEKNGHALAARVRLTIFRGDGNLKDYHEAKPGFIIQSFVISPSCGDWNEKGLVLDIFPDAVKPCDKFSAHKTNSFLPYVMASVYAFENKLDDAILLNQYGRICDTSIANIFIVNDMRILTPPLTEGCIAGVYRKHLINKLPELGMQVLESSLLTEDLAEADAIFLTNSIQEIKWVESFQGKSYLPDEVYKIYSLLQSTI